MSNFLVSLFLPLLLERSAEIILTSNKFWHAQKQTKCAMDCTHEAGHKTCLSLEPA